MPTFFLAAVDIPDESVDVDDVEVDDDMEEVDEEVPDVDDVDEDEPVQSEEVGLNFHCIRPKYQSIS